MEKESRYGDRIYGERIMIWRQDIWRKNHDMEMGYMEKESPYGDRIYGDRITIWRQDIWRQNHDMEKYKQNFLLDTQVHKRQIHTKAHRHTKYKDTQVRMAHSFANSQLADDIWKIVF